MNTTKRLDQERPSGRYRSNSNGEKSKEDQRTRRIRSQNGSCENCHQGDNCSELGWIEAESGVVRGVGGRRWTWNGAGRGSSGSRRRRSGRGRRASASCLGLECVECLVCGGVNGKNHSSLTMGSLFAIEPQRSSDVDNSEAPLRDHCRVGSNRQIVGIDAKGRGSQPSARVGEA